MANQHTKHGRKALAKRQEEADARDEARAARTNEEQIALIKKRPGNSAKELAKLS